MEERSRGAPGTPSGASATGSGGCGEEARWELALPLLLGSLVLFAVVLGLEPLLLYAAWGSDSGEYALLTAHLLSTGHFLLSGYTGWGFAYPYFPGTFEVGAAVAGATGADPLLALEASLPVLAALGAVPFFLLFRELFPSTRAAFLGASLTAVASARLIIISHAAPQTLGDLLWVASLYFLVAQRRDPRWMVLLALSSSALILTHHLSSYFFLISGFGLVVGVELFSPGRWARRFPSRELLFLGLFSLALISYWVLYAPSFGRILIAGLGSNADLLAPAGVLAVTLLAGLVVRFRRRAAANGRFARPLWHFRWPSSEHVWRDGLILGVLLYGALLTLLFVPLPGTQDRVSVADLLWFSPLLLYVPLASGVKGLLPASRLGPGTFMILLAVGLSAAFALATANAEIPPDRHPEFLIPPVALVTGIAIERILAGAWTAGRVRTVGVALAGVAVLLGANAAVAYPPPSVLVGFQEGFTPADTAVASWAATSLAAGASLGSDHRLSDLYFFDSGGYPATWNNATCLFEGSNPYCWYADLEASYLPNPPLVGHVDAIAIDATMVNSGVALNPSLPAVPMSAWALQKLQGPGFVVLYSQGAQQVFWVDFPAVTAP